MIEKAIGLVMAWAPLPAHDYENWAAWRILEPHGRFLWREQGRSKSVADDPEFLNGLGVYLVFALGTFADARPVLERALAARERVLGADHPSTLGSVNNLAYLYTSQRRHGEAEPLYERAVRGAEKVLGSAHPHTKLFRSNLESLRKSR
jgi:hypothetical protein